MSCRAMAFGTNSSPSDRSAAVSLLARVAEVANGHQQVLPKEP